MGIYREPVRPDFWQLAKKPDGTYLDPWGPQDCTTHSAARAAMRHYEGIKPSGIVAAWPPTGGAIRQVTRNADGTLDRSNGTTHSQMKAVLAKFYGMTLDVQNGLSWDTFLAEVRKGRGAMISVRYRLIAASPYSGQSNFYANHEMFVESLNDIKKTLRVVDPLADGRRTGVYRGPGDYPMELIKKAAGELVLDLPTGRQLGYGKVYAAFTQATGEAPVVAPSPNVLLIAAGTAVIWIASVTTDVPPKIGGWRTVPWNEKASSAPCGPELKLFGTSSGYAIVARVNAPTSPFDTNYIRVDAAVGTSTDHPYQ